MDSKRMVIEPGDHVIFIDSHRNRRNALVTISHGEPSEHVVDGKSEIWFPCVNLVVVSNDPAAIDTFGRQIERDATSVPHRRQSSAGGYCWAFPDELT